MTTKKATIFIETGGKDTSEYNFVATLLEILFGERWNDFIKIVTVGGKNNLSNLAPRIEASRAEGNINLVIFDADDDFELRKKNILKEKEECEIDFELFLFPTNSDNGCFENLLIELTADKHRQMLSCFKSYEACVKSKNYYPPKVKDKAYSFIHSMKLSNEERKYIGKGRWLFTNSEYWNLESEYLLPLKEFLRDTLLANDAVNELQ